jgi:hypothetical protein
MSEIDDAPAELADLIREFWPTEEWDNAAAIAHRESNWSPFATADTRTAESPCGALLTQRGSINVAAEYSIGWFQINACNLPADWVPGHLYNSRHNVGTAHMMWAERGWKPWYFSAKSLGLI